MSNAAWLGVLAGLVLFVCCKPVTAAEPSPCTAMGDNISRCVYADAVYYKYYGSPGGGIACRFDPPSR